MFSDSPTESGFNCLIRKTCSHCCELSEVLWIDLFKCADNKTSLPVFPFLNTLKGTSVMQFPSTWCSPNAAGAVLKAWVPVLLYQHYDGEREGLLLWV